MKKNLTITLLILALLSIALSMVFYAEDPHFPPGEGSSNDPYIVTTADQLYAVRSIWDGTVRLEADIVLNDETFTFRPDTGLVMVTDGTNVGYLGTGTKGDASGENTVFDTVASEAGVWYASDTSAEVYACLNLGNVHGKETAAGIAWLADAVLQSINSASVYGDNAFAITSEATRSDMYCTVTSAVTTPFAPFARTIPTIWRTPMTTVSSPSSRPTPSLDRSYTPARHVTTKNLSRSTKEHPPLPSR